MPCASAALHLPLTRVVGFAEQRAPFGMAEDDAAHAAARSSIGGEISPVNAPLSAQHIVLRAEADPSPPARRARPQAP